MGYPSHPPDHSQNLKKYDLVKTCDPANPVNQDDDLADRFFQAGMDTAVEVGMLCTDTQRRITFSREEIDAALEAAPSQFTLGEGEQAAVFKYRGVEDPTETIWVCPLSIAMTEDLFLPVLEGIARIPEVDCIEGPSVETLWGSTIRAGSPYEMLVGK